MDFFGTGSTLFCQISEKIKKSLPEICCACSIGNRIFMKMSNLLKCLFASLAVLSASLAFAAVESFTLASGDCIKGEPLESKDGRLSVKTAYGMLSIPVKDIAKRELVADAKADVKLAEANVAPAPEPAPAPAPKKAEDPAAPDPVERDPQWVEDYRTFVAENFPEGWQFRIRGGLELKKTDSSTFSVYAGFDVKKEWDINIFTATAYYNYTTQTSAADVKDVTIDNYGLDTSFKRFFNSTKTWYLSNLLNYKHDEVKLIEHQIDEAITFGYRFDFKRHNLVIDIGPGPAVRYTDSRNQGPEWVAMALIQEDLTWLISKTFRMEQSLNASSDLMDFEKYSATFKIAVIAHLTDVADLALRYSLIYDNISSSTVQTEQRLIIAFEFPFNWK